MSEEQVSIMARLHAERLMRGDTVSDAEMRVIIAGLMLSVDKLAAAFEAMRENLWSEDRMRKMIAKEIELHCHAKEEEGACAADAENKEPAGARWFGRMIRAIFGA